MVKLSVIREANTHFDDLFSKFTPIALFVGATNGVGRNTIKHFAKITRGAKPRLYFVGRSRERGEQLKSELKAINPDGQYEFISADISLLASVDDVCLKVKEEEQYLNLLFMSQGTTQRNDETIEGLPFRNSVVYYSKFRFAVNLIPLMQQAPVLRRSVFVFGSGLEGTVAMDDLEGRHLSALRNRDSVVSMTSLAIDKLSQEAPDISWVHNFPGFVESGIWDGLEGTFGAVFRTLISVLGFFWYIKPEECGQRQMFMATSLRFPAVESSDIEGNGITPAMGINGEVGGGSYTVDQNGDPVGERVLKLLAKYRKDGTQDAVWKNTLEHFQKITGKEHL